MSFAFTQDVPINRATYESLMSELGSENPPGLISHLAMSIDSGLRYVDVWESQADWERFVEERLHPALGRMFSQAGTQPPAEPELKEVELVHLWQP